MKNVYFGISIVLLGVGGILLAFGNDWGIAGVINGIIYVGSLKA